MFVTPEMRATGDPEAKKKKETQSNQADSERHAK
jgi:hypothetical protein